MKQTKVRNIILSNGSPFCLIAGPCVIESADSAFGIAEFLKTLCSRMGISFIYKASYDKANRTSLSSFRGPGLEKGLAILGDIRDKLGIPVLTDVHEPSQVAKVAAVADVIQIPAFLMRQTDLVVAVSRSGKPMNIKKAQFSSAAEVVYAVEKAEQATRDIILTERGNSFGYNDLVVDFRNLEILKSSGYPVVFDATHSVQSPGAGGGKTSGRREFVPALARAAVAVGVAGLFMEVHPDPDKGMSDAANMFPLSGLEDLLSALVRIDGAVKHDQK
jgi:2-dehydro-3-deoxyphosphooctonate aldolase (KDO 8-P synthase)